ncbi:MAG: PCRF domain-containing protein, partial [Oscillospiraceae bacterium]|nr:PCRF domain-containing protein [Oscillospiraceae bacterium]
MIELDERGLALRNMKPDLDDLASALGVEKMKLEISELEQKAAQPGFWDDPEASQAVLKRSGSLKTSLAEYEALQTLWEDAGVMIEMAEEMEDASMIPEIDEMMQRLTNGMETQRLATLLTGDYDSKDAILTFHAGAGGTEAQDWAEMLYRMYNHWADAHGYKVTLLDYLDGDEAGLKSASIQVEGHNAYGFL